MRPILLALAAAAPLLPAQASLAGPRLFPRGARAPGTQSVAYDHGQAAWLFTLHDPGGKVAVRYRLPLAHPCLGRGVLRIEETATGVVPMAGGGLLYRTQAPGPADLGRLVMPHDLAFSAPHDPNHTGTLLGHSLDQATGTVSLRFRDEYLVSGNPVASEKVFEVRLYGRSLMVRARSLDAARSAASHNHAGFAFGPGEGLAQPARVVHIPYMDMIPVFMGADGVFVTRFLDFYASSGSDTPSVQPIVAGGAFAGETMAAVYRDDTFRRNAAVDETAWITVSPAIRDVFPAIDRPPSEYRLHAAGRSVSQNGPGNRYDKAAAWVQRAAALGVDQMVQIKWDWHRWPFNLNDPDYLPPPPAAPCGTVWGTTADWLHYAGSAAASNWPLALYFAEDIHDPGYPNLNLVLPGSGPGSVLLTANPAYVPGRSVRDAAGNAKLGWDTTANLAGTNLQGQGHPTEVIGPHLRAGNLAGYGARIRGAGGFPAGGAHIDAQTGVPGWIHIDQRAGSGFPRTIAENLRHREASFRAAKDGLEGPLFGENSHWRHQAFESYAAGLLDGTSRKIPISWNPAAGPPDAVNWDYLVVPDFELLEVLPKAGGFFGMGWEFHFQKSGYPVKDAWIDAWHATLLSYAHAPFFSTNGDVANNYWDWQRTLRSHFLLQGLSGRLRAGRVREVRYVDGGGAERTLEEALALGLDLIHPRLVVRLEDGLELKANHAAAPWATTVLGRAWTLPPDGFAGAAPDGLLALSAVNPASGVRVDYASTPGHSEAIDRRGTAQSLDGFPGSLLPIPPGLFNPPVGELDLLVVKDLRKNQAVYAAGFQTAARPLGPEPALLSLEVEADDTTTLSLGRLRLGLRAVASDASGGRRDVTGLAAWTSSNPAIARVNRWGGVAAGGAAGTARITAALGNLNAWREVEATPLPVLGPLRVEALFADKAFFSVETDDDCPATALLVYDLGAANLSWVLGRPDPPRKRHQFAVAGLGSRRTYGVLPVAVNGFLLLGVGGVALFTTP